MIRRRIVNSLAGGDEVPRSILEELAGAGAGTNLGPSTNHQLDEVRPGSHGLCSFRAVRDCRGPDDAFPPPVLGLCTDPGSSKSVTEHHCAMNAACPWSLLMLLSSLTSSNYTSLALSSLAVTGRGGRLQAPHGAAARHLQPETSGVRGV